MNSLQSQSTKFTKVPAGNIAWHDSFDGACRAAAATGKGVLLFQMMGSLNNEFCETNARLTRAVLFSRRDVADVMNGSFECAWQAVRPVPIIQIDFGQGNVVTRTLKGNVATYVCFPDGQTVDVLPGLYEPATYKRNLERLALLERKGRKLQHAARQKLLSSYHATQGLRETWCFTVALLKGFSDWSLRAPRTEEKIGIREESMEEGVWWRWQKTADLVTRWRELYLDTLVNETVGRREVHRLLRRSNGGVTPQMITKTIYKNVLHTDIDDPYLGLGPVLFGGYPFVM